MRKNIRPMIKKKHLLHVSHKKQFYDMFSYLASDLHDCLVIFKRENENGYPYDMKNQEEWFKCLDAMIYSFKEIRDDHPDDPYRNYLSKNYPFDVDKDIVKQLNQEKHIPEYVDKEEAEYNNKIKKGLHLFAEYFQDLWD